MHYIILSLPQHQDAGILPLILQTKKQGPQKS